MPRAFEERRRRSGRFRGNATEAFREISGLSVERAVSSRPAANARPCAATVKSPVKFVFGRENDTIAAVPEGEVKEARPDTGRFHPGVDKECLPAGQEIVRGTPDWVHFGTGSDNIEMSLTPGKHTFAVQVGDDLHRAVEGLCRRLL
jgi:hypothetical protein